MPVDKNLLNIFVNEGAKISAAIFNRLPERLSRPGDFLVLRLLSS